MTRPPVERVPGERGAVLLLWFAVGGTLLAGVLPLTLLPVLVPVLAVLVALRAWPRMSAARLPVTLVLVVTWILLSWTWSADRAGSVRAFVDVVAAVSAGVVVGAVLDLDRTRRALSGLVKALIVANVVALLVAPEWSTRPPEGDPAPGWHALMSHKNGLGALLMLAVALLLCESWRRRFWWSLPVIVLLIGSQSATAQGVSLVLIAVALWAATLREMEQPAVRAAVRVVSGALVAVGIAMIIRNPGLVTSPLGRSSNLTGRTDVWGPVRARIAEEPLLGLGWGGVWREGSPVTEELWREARFDAHYAHNAYLDVLLQVGSIGGVLFLLLLLSTLVGLLSPEHRQTSLWGVLFMISFLLVGITESEPLTGFVSLLMISLLSTAGVQRPGAEVAAVHPLRPPPARTTGPSRRRAQTGRSTG